MKTKIACLLLFTFALVVVYKSYRPCICSSPFTTTMANLRTGHSALIAFHSHTGRFPSQEEGLRPLLEKPSDVNDWQEGGYLDDPHVVTDGWGNDFIYVLMPEGNPDFILLSLGADGKSGGKQHNRDLFSTDIP